MKKDIDTLQEIISYHFKDVSLLKEALTHSSFANEAKDGIVANNERLEFLGDAVLELVSSDYLFKKLSNIREGELSTLRAKLVCENSLAYSANKISLGDYIFLSNGMERDGGRNNPSIISDAMEAVFGAMYLDGGIEVASKLITELVLSDSENRKKFVDSKTYLQELLQAHSTNVTYEVVSLSGPDHRPKFVVAAKINGKIYKTGEGKSKKEAEQNAALETIKYIESCDGIFQS
ncbi:MAG: ribonuclease III [Lachnospiraceae bacterium]|nr:ribonuclease III [Lachnospiraceae bacterium]